MATDTPRPDVTVRCQAEYLGTDHFLAAFVAAAQLRDRGLVVAIDIVPCSVSESPQEFVGVIELRPANASAHDRLRDVLPTLDVWQTLRRTAFDDLAVAATTPARTELERLVRQLMHNLQLPCHEWGQRGDYSGPYCLNFSVRAVQLAEFLAREVAARLST